MFHSIKAGIKHYISREINKGLSQVVRKIPVTMAWDDQITINLPPKWFDNLADVSQYRDGITHIKPEDLALEENIDAYIDRDTLPLPSTEDREGYMGERHFEFWLGGLDDYLKIKHALKRQKIALDPGFSLYDMGCASGRVLRHFLCQENGLELWGSDVNSRHVEWVSRYLGGGIKVFQNHGLPHLPIEDNSFDLVYAFSVFSHIDAFEDAWLLELRRITRRGGILYLTIHSDHTWEVMREGGAITLYESLLNHPEFSPALLKENLPRERTVFRYGNESSYRANIFYDTEYIRRMWGRYFDIAEIIQGGHQYQDVVVLRKGDRL